LALPEPSAEVTGARSSSESASDRLRSGPGCADEEVGVEGAEVGVDGDCASAAGGGGGFWRRSRMDLAVCESLECTLLRHEAFLMSFSRKGVKTSTRRGSDSGGVGGDAAAAEAIIPLRDPVAAAAPRRVDLDLGGAWRGFEVVWIGEWGVEEKGAGRGEGCAGLRVVDLRGELRIDGSVSSA